ncbi:MAG: C39 family peptidase [Peptostreptococcaceae bacterium]
MNYSINKMEKIFPTKKILMTCIILIGLLYISFTKINSNHYVNDNPSVLNNEIIEILETQSHSNSKIKYILNNINEYPNELLKLLSKNPETVDFVYNYPKHNANSNSKNISVKEYYTPGEIPLFLQWDQQWGYDNYGNESIATGGCAPTSLAMVAVALTGDTSINPLYVSEYAYKSGYYVDGVGSKWSLISEGVKHFGLNSEELPLDKSTILSTLKSGDPIILTVGPGTFTSTGHFLVLTGITSDGKITINDPNSELNSSKTWDVDVFLKETKNLWKISKL